MATIKGGYYIKARRIQESEIAHSPPHFREIWDWLLKEANHKDNKVDGKIIERGQCFCTYNSILDGLSWKVGWRKQRYKKSGCENAMKFLRSRSMVTTTKTTRGIIVTILNYNKYQDPKNYESHNESHNESCDSPQTPDAINKNEKNDKKKERKKNTAFPQKTGEKAGPPEPPKLPKTPKPLEPFYLTKKKRKLTGWKLETFELFWKTFHWFKDKANAADAWLQIPGLTQELAVKQIIPAAARYCIGRSALIAGGYTPKWAQGWLSSRRWEDEKYEDDKDGLNDFLRRHG